MGSPSLLRACVLLAAAPAAFGFKFMSNWKMPTPQDILQRKEANDRFGEKKLVVITGTSSGLGRKTARALLLYKDLGFEEAAAHHVQMYEHDAICQRYLVADAATLGERVAQVTALHV